MSLYDGETFEHKGRTFKVEFDTDQDHEPPWEDGDGQGIVTDWVRRGPREAEDLDDDMLNMLVEEFGGERERLLCSDHGSYRYYDMEVSYAKALKEGWDTEPFGQGTPEERARRAVEKNYSWIYGWCNDQWAYVTVKITLMDEDDEETDETAWRSGESDDDAYLESEAREAADEILSRIAE